MKRMVLVIALCLAFVACNEELTHPSGLASDPTSLMRTDHAASLTPVSLDSLVRGGNFVFTLHVRFAMAGQVEGMVKWLN